MRIQTSEHSPVHAQLAEPKRKVSACASFQQVLSSHDWVAYFHRNARAVPLPEALPPATASLPDDVRALLAGSLTAWQLGETSDGRHLRAAARQYAVTHNDPAFLAAVDLFICEEQRHGAALGRWLDAVGIPRKTRDLGDSLFRWCRYAIPNYAVWAAVVVMVEAMAEIYYAAIRRITPCPRLAAECDQILRDEVRHLQFQCEHLAFTRRNLPRVVRSAVYVLESGFFHIVCIAVFIGHGKVLRHAGLPWSRFRAAAAKKFRYLQTIMNPDRYQFPSCEIEPCPETVAIWR